MDIDEIETVSCMDASQRLVMGATLVACKVEMPCSTINSREIFSNFVQAFQMLSDNETGSDY